jgi:hypothetical protein
MDTQFFGRALYYPHIFPQSRRWLRTAALYHDGISRIVPHGFLTDSYDRHNGIELLRDFEELQAANFIEDQHPDPFLESVGESFLDFLTPLLDGVDHKTKLQTKLGSRHWKPYNMYRDKISQDLLSLLEEQALVNAVNDYEVEFDASIGGLYMLFLASQMAQQQPIISDDPVYELLATWNLPSAPEVASIDRGFVLASAIFTSAVPIDIESVNIRDLILFREDHRAERIEFYEWMAHYSADLAKIKNRVQLQQAVDHYGEVIGSKMSTFSTKLKALGVKCATGIFSFSIPWC